MIRKSHLLLALALVAAAVAAPIAQSSSAPKGYPLSGGTGFVNPLSGGTGFVNTATYPGNGGAKVDPLAVGYLMGQGLSPSEVTSWTVGACSHQVKAASCYAILDRSASSTKPVDPLAVGYLMGQGLSPSQVRSWTVGACSHQVKDASCYAMFPSQAAPAQNTSSPGFQWGDAGIGAGFTLGIVLLIGGAGAGLLIARRNGRHQTARAA